MQDTIIVSNIGDSAFAIGVAHFCQNQTMDISDIISLESFANKEFCPKFLFDNTTEENFGYGLKGKTVIIISTASAHYSRNELAMHNFIVARSAKENGAKKVVLIEPDLFYSAQDRGPRTTKHPQMTDFASKKKFAGQGCSAYLYAELLKKSGVDTVITVHNHKPHVLGSFYKKIYNDANPKTPSFISLDIAHIVANYILSSNLARTHNLGENIGFVAPDSGAVDFVSRVRDYCGLEKSILVNLEKTRRGQRDVRIDADGNIELLKGKDVFILDDMVRTGGTIAASSKLLVENKTSKPNNIFFYCTHTYISPEGRENLNSKHISQFITTNTIPNILNRDDQGRLRKKTVVLKLEKWIANAIFHCLENEKSHEQLYSKSSVHLANELYTIDVSSRNPRNTKSQTMQYEFALDSNKK